MKRKKPAIPLVGAPEEKKAKTDEKMSKTGPKVDQSVRNQWRLAQFGTESRPKGSNSQGVIDPEARFYQNGKPRDFMVRGDGAYKVGKDGKVHKPNERYAEILIDGRQYKLHTLVCAAFNGLAPSEKHEVDHVLYQNEDSSEPADVNAAWNLRWVTKSENIQFSHDHNLNRKKRGEQAPRKLYGVYGKRVGEELAVHYFEDAAAAAKMCNLEAREVDKCAKGEREQTGGWEFYYPPETAPEGEEMRWEVWRKLLEEPDCTILGSVKRLSTRYTKTPMVSNLGRYKDHTDRRSFGTNRDNGYCVVSVAGKKYLLHTLVQYAFNKTLWNKSYTSVDHINRVRHDNTLGNLQWSNAVMQQSNVDKIAKGAKTSKTKGSAVEVCNPSMGENEWQCFDSCSMAQEATAVDCTVISMNLKKRKPGEIYIHKNKHLQPSGWQFRQPQPTTV